MARRTDEERKKRRAIKKGSARTNRHKVNQQNREARLSVLNRVQARKDTLAKSGISPQPAVQPPAGGDVATRMDGQPEPRPMEKYQAQPQPAPAPVAQPQPAPAPVAQPQPAPAPVAQPQPAPVAQPQPAPVAQPQPAVQPQPAPAPVAQPQPAVQPPVQNQSLVRPAAPYTSPVLEEPGMATLQAQYAAMRGTMPPQVEQPDIDPVTGNVRNARRLLAVDPGMQQLRPWYRRTPGIYGAARRDVEAV